ncbi:MAG: hypothetical protein LLG01_02730 [Planctomycetaceae bacterium]|nr:hypothetical protein [Planctomycetaceae bacterium]
MLEKLNKLAPYLAAGIMGYMAYCAGEGGPAKATAEKASPLITREMLRPTLMSAPAGAAVRDPFEVDWASYLTRATEKVQAPKRSLTASTHPADAPRTASSAPAKAPASQPASQAASAPASPSPPPLPLSAVTGICLGEGISFIVVGDMIYKTGDVVGGADEASCWVIDSIEANGATLRFGAIRKKLLMPAPKDPGPRQTPAHARREKSS